MSRKETIPLLHDHHTHPSQYSSFFHSADLSGIEDKNEATLEIKENSSKGELNVVLGWNNSYYDFSEQDLKDLPPIIICNVSFHGFTYNNKAEKSVEKRFGSTDILGKLNDSSWMEKNLPKIMSLLVRIEGIDEEKLNSFYDFLKEKGIWKVEDMLLPHQDCLETFNSTEYNSRTEFWTDIDTYKDLDHKSKEQIKGIKIFTDGALGPRTAALREPYPDGSRGELLHDTEELERLIKSIEKDRISIHAIGDRAIDNTIDTIRKVEKKGHSLPQIRMEHLQFLSRQTAEEAKRLDITLCMQPNFSLDSIHYSDRLSEKYLERNNPFRMLIDDVGFESGSDLIFGSDGMPHGVETALKSSLFPPYSGQKLSLKEIKEGYCLPDDDKGFIELEIDESREEVSIEKIKCKE